MPSSKLETNLDYYLDNPFESPWIYTHNEPIWVVLTPEEGNTGLLESIDTSQLIISLN